MRLYYIFIICLVFISYHVHADDALCFSGSTLYQRVVVNCNEQQASYNGTWYCSKISVCETEISSQRQCIVTRGCATEAQCINPATSAPYDGEKLLNPAGQIPAGMNLYPTCCQATKFVTDDAVAVNYGDICNAASSNMMNMMMMSVMGIMMVYFMMG